MIPEGFLRLLMATRNEGKLREFRRLMSGRGVQIIGLREAAMDRDHEETGTTFAENASLKALAYSRETGLPVLADDSGLEVRALEGRPGVHSARYAGPGASDRARISRLLAEIERAQGPREARFVCALALARRGRLLLEATGTCDGEIAPGPRGDNGFGYDPVFLVPELRRTFAELNEEEKNRISHRARAVESLLAKMQLLQ